jgi:hypothetical protein
MARAVPARGNYATAMRPGRAQSSRHRTGQVVGRLPCRALRQSSRHADLPLRRERTQAALPRLPDQVLKEQESGSRQTRLASCPVAPRLMLQEAVRIWLAAAAL